MQDEPVINKTQLWITRVAMFGSASVVVGLILGSWFAGREEPTDFIIIFVAILIAMAGYRHNRRIKAPLEAWKFRQSVTIHEEKELLINDQFTVAMTVASGDSRTTSLFPYIHTAEGLYAIHPYATEKFLAERAGPGSVLRATIIKESNGLSVLEYDILKLLPLPGVNSRYDAAGIITEKFAGFPPNGINPDLAPDFPNVVTDPQLALLHRRFVHLQSESGIVRSVTDKTGPQFFLRINRHFEAVSPEDFAQFQLGEEVTFERDEKSGLSAISAGKPARE